MERELGMETFRMQPVVDVREEPLKAVDGITLTGADAQRSAEIIRDTAEVVDPEAAGTCIDERIRASLLNGEAKIEARYPNPGGPDIYGLYIAELTGYFGDSSTTGKERLVEVKEL